MKLLFVTLLLAALTPAQRPTFTLTTNVVVINTSVLDRDGKPIEKLTRDDFEVYEDGKLQKLQSVDLQKLSNAVLPPVTSSAPASAPAPSGYNPDAERAAANDGRSSKFQDRRLMILLFDFGSMQPAEQIRARDAAIQFLSTQMTASDLVSVMTFGSELKTALDFTGDRDLLLSTLKKFRIGESSENAAAADTGADAQDQSGSFVADETEFNIFNADLKLAALEDAARKLGQYPEKKALVYLSSGIQKSGVDNQSQLRATVNTAVRANVAFYPIDARGLTALVPGGDASQGGAAGNGLFNGSGQRSQKESFNNQQESLSTLATETGGKALLYSNDLALGMRQVQQDFSSYYVLSYVSSNTAQDGRYRRIQVKLSPRIAAIKPKLDYRSGYFAPTTFARMKNPDKESQLSQALLSGNPVTDLPLAVEVDYFRLSASKYFVPVSVKVPGSALAFESKGSRQATELDFIADIRDERNRPASTVRDTIPLKLDEAVAGAVRRKSLQYDTGVTLGPGKYKLKFVARENGAGKVGTFETPFTVPDLAASSRQPGLHVSSVIVSAGREKADAQVAGIKNDRKLVAQNPLIEGGQKLVPSVTHAFRPGQNVLVYLEVYDPAIPDYLPENFRRANVQATVALYRDSKRVYQSVAVRANQIAANRTATLPVWLQLPLKEVQPGQYECQVNVIDEFGRKFAFPRTPVAVLPPDAKP